MDIKRQLTDLSENDLREKVIMPMIDALGAFKTENFHGPSEKGKDVYFAYVDLFGLYKHCCVFIKKGDVRKSGRNDIRKMESAINEAILRDFVSPIDNQTRVSINELCFICSGKINKEARDYISEMCRKKYMPNIRIFDIDDLVKIILDKAIGNSGYKFRITNFKDFCRSKGN